MTRLNVGGIARYLEMGRDAVGLLARGRVGAGESEAAWTGPQVWIPGLARAIRPADDARALSGLLALVRRRKPDVVHTHASKAGALGRLAARLAGVPSVHTFHGHVLDGYFPRPAARVIEAIERRLARGSTITATGPATAAALQARLGVPVEVLPPGIALPAPDPGARARWRTQWGEPQRVALAIGRAAAVKRLDRFVDAARGAGFLPVVAGTTQVRGAVALGAVADRRDLAGLYAASDVVVSSSRTEGTPFALLEAAWCGRPVVAPPVGDVAWIVGGGGLVDEDIESALRRMRDPDLRAELGRTGAREVRERFPAAAVAPRLRALYASLAPIH
ncbi:MAG: glycosyltransferase family 4 protein [Planctomycetota bacterium]